MKNQEPMNICYVSDNTYAPYVGIAIASIMQNHPNHKINFFILDNGIQSENKQKLEQIVQSNASISFVSVFESEMENYHFPHGTYLSPAIFYRIKIPEIFAHLDRVLYLDVDTLVLGDLRSFYEMDMNQKPLALAFDVDTEKQAERLKLPHYFNSGVILFDIKACQKNNITQRFLETLKSSPNLLFPDQDIINMAFQNEIEPISDVYNMQIDPYNSKSIEMIQKNFKKIKILHYITSAKPWAVYGNPFEQVFFDIWKNSLWKEDYNALMRKRWRKFLYHTTKLDRVKTTYLFNLPILQKIQLAENKTIKVFGLTVFEKRVKYKL